MNAVEATITEAIVWLKLAAETLGALVAGVGVVVAAYSMVRARVSRQVDGFRHARLRLSRFLVLALEFQLAADILATSIAPSWEQLGKLGAVAIIRTFLNYFLSRDMAAIEAEESAASTAGGEGSCEA